VRTGLYVTYDIHPNIEIRIRSNSSHGIGFAQSTMLSGGVPMSSLMGVIEDTYADLDADITEEEFRAAVEEKAEDMGGFADNETAAQIVAHELGKSKANMITDIDPEMSDVEFAAKVTSIGDLRTFERDDSEGYVLNVECADETGRVRISLWDEDATAGDEELEAGQVLRIKGTPKEGYNGLEVSATRVKNDPDTEIDVTISETDTIDGLSLGQSDITLAGKVLAVEPVRTFSRDDGSEGRVSNLVLGDDTGRVRATLWDEQADCVEDFSAGQSVEIVDGYVRERDGTLEVHVGSSSAIEPIDEDVTFVPDATSIETLEIGRTVDIAGVVRSTDPKRTFDRDDGSEGQVRNVRVQDQTGDIRVALWGEKADTDLGPGDEVLFADVEIQDGWKDDLEASAGWSSTISLLDDGAMSASEIGTSHTGDDTSEQNSETETDGTLASFTTDSDEGNSDPDSGTDSNVDRDTGLDGISDSDSDTTSDSESERREFTGIVVQTGNPVMIDNGTETLTVKTDADVRLGEEVTARGQIRNGTLDAEDVL
jgi:ssDNA-binding replication factor A large subunit